MLFSKNGFKSVDTAESFIKEAIEFGNKDIVLSVVHNDGVIDFVFSPSLDAIEAEVYHFLNDGTELKYTMPIKMYSIKQAIGIAQATANANSTMYSSIL